MILDDQFWFLDNKNAILASYFPMIPHNFGMEKYYYKPIYMTDIRLSILI